MDYIEYTSAMMNEMHDIVEELGLKKKKSNSLDLLDNMKGDLAFQTFIVSSENLSIATLVGYEMGIKYLEAAVYYSYLIALPSAEKQPSFFKSLLTKKDSSQIDYKNQDQQMKRLTKKMFKMSKTKKKKLKRKKMFRFNKRL